MAEGRDDIDAQFRDLVASMDADSATSVEEPLHLEGGSLSVALVLAPIPSAEALHALLSLSGYALNIVRMKPWSAVWIQVRNVPADEDEFDSLLPEEREMPEIVDEVARAVSRLSKYGSVAIMSWLVEGEGAEVGVSGQLTARRYVSGEPEDAIPAGVLLGCIPEAAEDLLLGRTRPEDYDDSVASDGTTRRPRGPLGWFRRK